MDGKSVTGYNYLMANQVFLNKNNIVEITVDGDQTVHSVHDMASSALVLCRELKGNNQRPLILDDLRTMGSVPPEGRKAVVDLIKSGEFDKLAMIGSNGLTKLGANLLLQATGKSSFVKYFDDRPKAVRWLLA